MRVDLTDWKPWSPRPEIAPGFRVEKTGAREKETALRIDSDDAACLGAWVKRLSSITGGKTYRFRARYRCRHVGDERFSVWARLTWLDAKGEKIRNPDFALDTKQEGVWRNMDYVTLAPPEARSVQIDLGFGWCTGGTIWWDDVHLDTVSAPRQRVVRAATVYHRGFTAANGAESAEAFCKVVEAANPKRLDILCLPEGITKMGNPMSYSELAEPVPGPTTERLGQLAKRLNSYIVAGIYERVGEIVYNTAVLVGRKGELVGTYRKTHLPFEEVESGITPGSSYPVFTTDFGKVGLMICWDVQFPEPARALARQGAEILLLPIWGGNETLAKARAIENHVFLISSSFDMKTFLIDPVGSVLAEATKEQPVAVAELLLDKQYFQPWLGDMKNRTWRECRPDIPVW
jgi:predicted amidohydrolase